MCGGIHLKNFPGGSSDKTREKRESLLTVIAACHDLSQEDQERLVEADVTVTKSERGKKGTLDVKIKLDQANELMRKVWSQLERACKEEGVKCYQIEASTPVSPVKEKPRTEFQKARLRVKELLKEEDERQAKEAEEQKKKKLETQHDEEGLQEQNENPRTEEIILLSPAAHEVGEAAPAQVVKEVQTSETKKAEDGDQQVDKPTDELEGKRIKEQRWTPPDGKRRCGGQCQGCQNKCEDQGLVDCHYCHLNKTKGGKNGCCNRKECTNLKPALTKGSKNKSGVKNISLAESLLGELLVKSPSDTSKVGTQMVTFHPGQVESLAKDLENKGNAEKEEDIAVVDGKRRRPEVGDTPPEQKRSSKMPTIRKDMGGSKLQPPVKASSLTN